MKIMTKWFRGILSDKNDEYVFRKYKLQESHFSFPKNGGLYIHVPFCTNMCPYCPYYKEPFEKTNAKNYKNALLKEIERYAPLLSQSHFSSLYFGGGTPTLILDDLFEIVECVKRQFRFHGHIGLETTPMDLTPQNLKKLKDLGVNLLSVGNQSFQDNFLKCIGRNYRHLDIHKNLEFLREYGFETVNFDMIFVYPSQTKEDIRKDIEIALSYQPDQITYYPLFTFPYTSIGNFRKLKQLQLPNIWKRKSMYYYIFEYLKGKGFSQTSVWSFNRKNTPVYSSVTRDFYLGFGPGAGSYTKELFYFNTFSVQEYVKNVEKGDFPVALKMDVSRHMAKLFWLYWRFYEAKILKQEYFALFDCDLKKDFPKILKLIKILGFVEKEDEFSITINKKGVHWIHLLQNYFALNYITSIWSAFQKTAYPEEVFL